MEKTMNWISVKDRLPESEQRVLIYDGNDKCFCVGWYAAKYDSQAYTDDGDDEFYYGKFERREDGMLFYAEGWHEEIVLDSDQGYCFGLDRVTHWMPLPDAPEVRKNESR